MKNYLLIGGSYGIGLELAARLSKSGTVYIASRTAPSSTDFPVVHIPFDALSDEFPADRLPESLDGFAYLPGSINLKPFRSLKVSHFEEDLSINFISMVRTLQSALTLLLKSPSPSIVLFSSVAAGTGMPFHTSIAAAKGAVEGFARALAAELAPKCRVNVVAQSLTDTPLAEKFLSNDAKRTNAAERHPLKRIGSVSDVANAAAFLLNEDNGWITGQVLHVDGGMSTLSV